MLKVPDLLAVLQQIARRAMAVPPRAPRGGVFLREGERLVARALAGFGATPPPLPRRSAAVEPDGARGPLTPEAALEAARGPRVVDARAWYRANLPSAIELDGAVPEGAGVLIAPISLGGEPVGYLAVEQPTLEPPDEDRRALIEVFADAAADALERNRLYDDKARSAQEIRLFERMLNAVGTTVELHHLIETIAHGIRSVQLEPDWKTVELWLLEDDAPGERAAGAGGDRRARVYRAPRSEPTTYWQNVHAGAASAGRDLGLSVDFRTGGGGYGAGSQSELLDDAIDRRVPGIVIAPCTPDIVEEGFRRAAEADIPVVVIDTPPVPGSLAPLYIGTDNVAAGRMAGEMMLRLLPGGGVVAPLGPVELALNARERVEGFRAATLGSNLTVLPTTACDWDLAAGTRLAAAALRARPDIGGAFGAAADNGPSWGLATSQLGRRGDLKIIGFDLIASTVALLRQGTIHATIVQREYDMGFRAVEVIHRMMMRGIAPILAELPPSRVLHTGVDCVTLERTPWSTPLADYLTLDAARRAASGQDARPLAAAHPAEILLIGLSPPERSVVEDQVAIPARSPVGRAIEAGRPLVLDPADGDGRADAALPPAHAGARTVVVLPLQARGSALGALVLSSDRRQACGPGDVSFLVRVSGTAAVGIENARLFRRISERSAALERAGVQRESMLQTIRALSSPVVPIAEGILVMPVIGVMDAQRSSHFIESMLRAIDAQGARIVLIDVTGMAVVDAAAASQLVRAAQAAALLGAEAVLVGLRPDAAQTMVDQGLDVGSMVTQPNLARGFRYALARTRGRGVGRRG
ncbi:substrate-binding domain-containing protein [Sorangium sp. So ce1036]|uniref:substrate-binding domain-containing protein n=1 Tax=Sorangium sp. So ce1036 TaxID=3133328 RepID=UPI003EFBCEC2